MTSLLGDKERVKWHDKALWAVRAKRDKSSQQIPEWEELRSLAAQVKAHTMAKLPHYLEEFESKAKALGVHVHWAHEAKDLRDVVAKILVENKVKNVVKSKSMLTEECDLNKHLEAQGIEVVDTDLGERIVQLAKETPSHIVLPAIHKKKEEISELFHEHMGSEKGLNDPQKLTQVARKNLRQYFLNADAAITGVNFAVAETGEFVVVSNEGNVDLGTSLAPLHIACMGIEKIIPRRKDLSVFLRLLARSATGQAITTYSSHFNGPREGTEMHVVIVNNARHKLLQDKDFVKALSCIRCGACMNTCPVYRRVGGHAYGSTVPGPIGSILSPNQDPKAFSSLPFKSTLCGSCTAVCPVKIDLHEQLLKWREKAVSLSLGPKKNKLVIFLMAYVLQRPKLFHIMGIVGRFVLRVSPRFLIYHSLNPWGKSRELPEMPKKSFKELYKEGRRK